MRTRVGETDVSVLEYAIDIIAIRLIFAAEVFG